VVDQPRTRRALPLALDCFIVVSLCVIATSWFTTSPLKPRATAILAVTCLLALIIGRRNAVFAWRPRASTVVVCGLGLLLRAPAMLEPAGFVSADGSLQALLVNGILAGDGPAPIFREGTSYQGSLKAHIGALASLFLGRGDLGLLVVVGSTLLWTIFVASTMALGRRLGGEVPAIASGLFAALSPRFATIFSVSNVGEYSDVLGLGTWALACTAAFLANDRMGFEARGGFFGIGLLLGIALWQQPIAISFAIVTLGILGWRAISRRDPWFLVAFVGLALGRLPVTIHDLRAESGSSHVVGGFLRSAGQSLPLADHVRGTLEWAFPVVFTGISSDSPWSATARIAVGMACVALFIFFLARAIAELRAARRHNSWAMVRAMAAAHFLVALSLIWLVAGGGQYSRPRYFLPLLTGFALALGDFIWWVWPRSRVAAAALAGLVIGSNLSSNLDRLQSGLAQGHELRALSARIEALGLKTGYSGVAFAGPLTMLTAERVSVDGILESAFGERVPPRHIDRVRLDGPDFYLADGETAVRLARRLDQLGVTYKVEGESPRLFHAFSRRVPLSEVLEAGAL
jgi:hypothetical protein